MFFVAPAYRLNTGLLALLPRQRQHIAICSNQGGMAFSRRNPAKFPTPLQVAQRLNAGRNFLARNGYPVAARVLQVANQLSTYRQAQLTDSQRSQPPTPTWAMGEEEPADAVAFRRVD